MLTFIIWIFLCTDFRFIGAGTGVVTLTLASLRSAIYFPEDVEKNTGRIIATDLRAPSPLLASFVFRLGPSLCNTTALP